MEPLVPILIPAYNAEAFIADTIKSALAQTWPRKDIVIVDDSSTDHPLRIARQFACEQLSVIEQEMLGSESSLGGSSPIEPPQICLYSREDS